MMVIVLPVCPECRRRELQRRSEIQTEAKITRTSGNSWVDWTTPWMSEKEEERYGALV